MNIKRKELRNILTKMVVSGLINLDEDHDIIDWDCDQLDELSLGYLNACGKDELKDIVTDSISDIDISEELMVFSGKQEEDDFVTRMKNEMYARIEDDIRDEVVDILTLLRIENDKHRRAEHEYSQSQVY